MLLHEYNQKLLEINFQINNLENEKRQLIDQLLEHFPEVRQNGLPNFKPVTRIEYSIDQEVLKNTLSDDEYKQILTPSLKIAKDFFLHDPRFEGKRKAKEIFYFLQK